MQSNTFEVDGHTYIFNAFGALEASNILGRVYSILGDGISEAKGDGAPAVQIAAIVGGLLKNLGDEAVIDIIKKFAEHSMWLKDGQPIPLGGSGEQFAIFDEHFSRRSVPMGKWFVACFTWQYADFLEHVRTTVLLRLVVLTESLWKSMPSSTGSSGESSPPSESPTAST